MAKLFTIRGEEVLCHFGRQEEILGYIHCCNGKRKTISYKLSPTEGFIEAEMDYLEQCPVCGHTVVQLTRIDLDNNVSLHRKVNEKARKLFKNLEKYILFKKESAGIRVKAYSKFYLYYNEFGVKKKCFANLSSLKIGLFDNEKHLCGITPSHFCENP